MAFYAKIKEANGTGKAGDSEHMKEKINRLAKGILEEEELQVSFSAVKIEDSVALDDRKRGEFRIAEDHGRPVKGLVYSTDQRVSLVNDNFMGKDCRIVYEVDSAGADADLQGEFQIVCSAGEYRLPYVFHVCAADPEGQQITELSDFVSYAETNPEEALRLFESHELKKLPFMQDMCVRTIYEELWGHGDRRNAMEEFLTASGAKRPVHLTWSEDKKEYLLPEESFSDQILVKPSGRGYTWAEVTSDSEWLVPEQDRIAGSDFAGEGAEVRYAVRLELLHAGNNYGELRIRGLYEELRIPVHVKLPGDPEREIRSSYERDMLQFYTCYLKQMAGEYEEQPVLVSMQSALARAYSEAPYPELIRLYQADIALLQDKAEQAREYLEDAKEKILDNRDKDAASYCYYMYLKARESKEPVQRQTMVKLLRRYYEDGTAPDMAFFILMQTDPELQENDSLALSRLKGHFRRGSRSPYLYLAACRIIKRNPGLLRVLEDFELQSFWFGLRYGQLDKEAAKAVARLAIQMKKGPGICLRLLKKLYELFPSEEALTAVCALLIRRDCRDEEAFHWYEKGVNEDIHLTRLYEYYLYALPADHEGALPRILLLYFSYNNTLDYRTQAALYLNVLTYMREDTEIFRAYENQIEAFAVDQLFRCHMNRDLAKIYSRMILPEMVDERIAKVLPRLLYAREIRCADPAMCQVIVAYEEMQGETAVPLRNGRAYVPVYLENAHVFFQDDHGNRYGSICYEEEPMMEVPELEEKTRKLYPAHEMLRLGQCRKILEKGNYTASEIALLKEVSQEDELEELFRRYLVSEIISYYYRIEESDACDEYLLGIDKKLLRPDDRNKVMDALITKDFYEDAYKMVLRYGYRNLKISRILKLTSRMIVKRLFEKDSMLLEMAWFCFDAGRSDDVILEYLCSHYNGLSMSMYRILREAWAGHVPCGDLPERLLAQMLFDGSVTYLDQVFRIYMEGKSVEETLVRAYLAVKSRRYFEGAEDWEPETAAWLEVQAEEDEGKHGLPEICLLALTKYYSEAESLTDQQKALCRSMIEELYQKRILFSYYQKLEGIIRLPDAIRGKCVIEYHGKRSDQIWIHETLEPDGTKLAPEQIPHMFDGYFVKLVSLFYGETMEYEIRDGDGALLNKGSVAYPDDGQTREGRAGRLDEILRAFAGGDDSLKERMMTYAVRDELTEKLFQSL